MEVTFKTNVAGSVIIRDNYYSSYPITETELTLEVETGITISPQQGFSIEKVVNKAGERLCEGQRDPFISYYDFDEAGDVITITVKEKEARNLTIYGDATQIYVQDGNYVMHRADDQTDGAWTLRNIGDYDFINIHCNDGYAISEIKDDKDNFYVSKIEESFQIGATRWEGNLTLYVKSVAFDDIRNKSFTLKINGTPASVEMSRSGLGATFEPKETETVIKYRDEETPLTFRHSTYGKKLYSVKLDDEPVATSGNYFEVTPTDGSTITIDTEFPDIDVPLVFELSSEEMKGAIKEFKIDNTNVTGWDEEGYTLKLGSNVYISLNSSDYNLEEVTVDGVTLSTYNYYGYDFTVMNEKACVIKITGTAKQPYTTTIVCDDYDKLTAYNGYGYDGDPIIKLTGKITEVKIPQSTNYITFKTNDTQYYVESTACEGNCENSYTSGQVKVTGDGGVIEVKLAKVERNNTLVVYVEEADWNTWSSISFGGYYSPTAFTWTPTTGYSLIKVGEMDSPMSPSFYLNDYSLSVYKYFNGEELDYYSYSVDFKDGDVFKVFAGEPDEFDVKYEIEEGTGLSVIHDYVTAIEEPSQHTVLEGTELHLVPTATTEAATGGKLVVKANDTEITPDESGKYVITVNADTTVKAYKDGQSGVENVAVDGETVNVYTIQGIEVLHNATPEQISQLPAGIYIAAGKKFVVR